MEKTNDRIGTETGPGRKTKHVTIRPWTVNSAEVKRFITQVMEGGDSPWIEPRITLYHIWSFLVAFTHFYMKCIRFYFTLFIYFSHPINFPRWFYFHMIHFFSVCVVYHILVTWRHMRWLAVAEHDMLMSGLYWELTKVCQVWLSLFAMYIMIINFIPPLLAHITSNQGV